MKKQIVILMWALVIVGVIVGVLMLFEGKGGLQQSATLALACAILPYCLARAISEIVANR